MITKKPECGTSQRGGTSRRIVVCVCVCVCIDKPSPVEAREVSAKEHNTAGEEDSASAEAASVVTSQSENGLGSEQNK